MIEYNSPKFFFILSKALVNWKILTAKFRFGCWKTLRTGIFTRGPFQLFFFENVFEPSKNNKIQNHRKLPKKLIETLLNKIFTTNKQENENEQVECCPRKINLGIFKIVDFGQELSCRFF